MPSHHKRPLNNCKNESGWAGWVGRGFHPFFLGDDKKISESVPKFGDEILDLKTFLDLSL